MTAIMVFVLREQTAQVRWLETAGVGVGVRQMGNKGAVGVRMGWSIGSETMEVTFVSAHLAPMEDAVERRNVDYKNIVRGLVFKPVSPTTTRKKTPQGLPHEESSEEVEPLLDNTSPDTDSIPPMSGIYTPTAHLFLAGDLNYRTSPTKPSPSSFTKFPQPCPDDSYPQHYEHLFTSDQLSRELKARRTCHGLKEAPVEFPPTYKYSDAARMAAESRAGDAVNMDVEGETWGWARHRWPSWCDRVLYLDLPSWMKATNSTAKIEVQGYKALPLLETSDHRPVACAFSIPATRIPEPDKETDQGGEGVRLKPPFGIDPIWKERRVAARRREVVVGLGAYLALTWEGRAILLAVFVGTLGGWAIIAGLANWRIEDGRGSLS